VPLNPLKKPNGILKTILWIIFLPVSIVFFLTIPDCRRKRFSIFPYYCLTFTIATIYLSILSYVLVWMVIIIGNMLLPVVLSVNVLIYFFLLTAYTVDMPDTVVGLTLLAAGTSLPEVGKCITTPW
jgi:sodium/potassium/calcium exchanger 5